MHIQEAMIAERPRLAAPPALPQLIKTGWIEIGPELAARILAEAKFARQRPLRAYHVRLLAHDMRAGKFSEGTQLHFARLGERLYLINGQHRLSALAEAGVSLRFQALITEAASEQEVNRLYWRHDHQQMTRGWSDIFRAEDIGAEVDLSERKVAQASAAMLWIMCGLRPPNVGQFVVEIKNPDKRLAALSAWWPTVATFYELIEPAGDFLRVRLTRATVMAAALMTLRYAPERAAEFWGGIARDDGLRQGDPRKTLIAWLTQNGTTAGPKTLNLRAVAIAWNAFMGGSRLSIIKARANLPLTLAGTPIGRRKGKTGAEEA